MRERERAEGGKKSQNIFALQSSPIRVRDTSPARHERRAGGVRGIYIFVSSFFSAKMCEKFVSFDRRHSTTG